MIGPRVSVRRVGKNTLARLMTQVGSRLLSLALAALVGRFGSAAGLGRYALVMTVVGIAGAVTDVGLNIYLTRAAARAEDHGQLNRLLGQVMPLRLGLASVGFVILLLIARVGSYLGDAAGLLLWGAPLLLPEAAMGIMRAMINGRQRMEVSGAVDLAVRALILVASVPLLDRGLGVRAVLGATLGASLTGVVAYALILKHWGFSWRWSWVPARWRDHLRASYPFGITAVAALAYSRVDLLLLGLWQGDLAAGMYSAAYRLWEAFGLLPASVLEAMFPEMSRIAGAENGRQRLRTWFRRAGSLLPALGVLLASAAALLAGRVMLLVFGAEGGYDLAVVPFRILVWGLPAMFLYLLCGHTLYAVDQQRRVTATMVLAGIANVLLNLYVIPRFNVVGAATVALCTEWLLLALLWPQALRALRRSTPAAE